MMIKNIKLFGVAVTTIISIGLLTACGNTADSNTADSNSNVSDMAEDLAETVVEEPSFGLQDFEGFYCTTNTEQIEDYEVTYTYGLKFNGDGTGMSYGQDVVPFTWNETEIHFENSTESYLMEPGKLTVDGISYDKIEGKLIIPNPYYVDVDSIEDGAYYAYIDKDGISEADGEVTIRAEIYTEDTYDIVDINSMDKGDVIYIKGQLILVDSIQMTDFGIMDINGGIENGGSALRAIDELNCFVYAGMDLDRSYSRQGITNLVVSDNVKLIDSYDPTEDKEYTGSDAISALRDIVEEYPLTEYNGKITVENNTIVQINRLYMP